MLLLPRTPAQLKLYQRLIHFHMHILQPPTAHPNIWLLQFSCILLFICILLTRSLVFVWV
jgi:hypothetical protein